VSDDQRIFVAFININVVPTSQPAACVEVKDKVPITDGGDALKTSVQCLFVLEMIERVIGRNDQTKALIEREVACIALDKSGLPRIDVWTRMFTSIFKHGFREIKSNDAIPLLEKIDRKMSGATTEIEDGPVLVSNRRGGIKIEDKRSNLPGKTRPSQIVGSGE